MPELPEVEVTRRALLPLVGNILQVFEVSNKRLRQNTTPSARDAYIQQPLRDITRRAKYLLWHFGDLPPLVSHLGMSGRFCLLERWQTYTWHTHDHVLLGFAHGAAALYHDPRRFEGVGGALPTVLGYEPLDDTLTPELLYAELQKRARTPIKTVLLNGHTVVGVGNIYASESLWLAQISPFCLAKDVSLVQCVVLLQSIRDILIRALEAGGSSFRDFASPAGAGYFQFDFAVYNRANMPCQRCDAPLLRAVQQGRSTYYCEICQPECFV